MHSLVRYKRLEKSSFCWPRIGPVRVQLNHAQLMALLEGLDCESACKIDPLWWVMSE
ncbi:IS66 family insertion sequence element accessory protein TnpB [Leisingera sp. ANG59]|uniref:IS66 family insertion sequence element accessory protein TnpB n=1 Tax=Leisingera sp. ANG59 TaxID=2675221 RepID=UPI001574A56E|nr:hypothetical protein [Leisingera sp. ANG59]